MPEHSRRFVLASASGGRLATLRAAGLDPQVVVSGVDESGVDDLPPVDQVLALARRKAETVATGLDRRAALVLGCDSLLELDGTAYGKPGTAERARTRWKAIRGRTGVLHTGHCVIDTGSGRRVEATASTTVTFAEIEDAELEAYIATGEPLGVAGGFTISGLGGAFVDRIEGDHHNVVGVSLPLLRQMLTQLDITWTDLWHPPR